MFEILEKLEKIGFGGCWKLKYAESVDKYWIVRHHNKMPLIA